MGKKFVLIGAGSYVFTRNLVRDILTFPAFQDATIALGGHQTPKTWKTPARRSSASSKRAATRPK